MPSVTLLLSVAVLWALAVVSPGPNFLMTARLSIARSRRVGLQAIGGIAVGTVGWAAAGIFGVRALFLAAPWMYLALKVAGAVYLLFVGAQLLWKSWRRDGAPDVELGGSATRLSPFQIGLPTTVANPRSAISVASIFATAMPIHPSVALRLLVMATMVAISAAWYTGVVCIFSAPYLANGYKRFRKFIDRAAGAGLIAFGAKLVIEP